MRSYVVQTHTSTEPDSGTDAMVHIALFGTVGDSGRRYLVNSLEDGPKFQAGKVREVVCFGITQWHDVTCVFISGMQHQLKM